MDDGGGGVNCTTGAIRSAKLQPNHHHQQTNIQFFKGRMPFMSPNQQCRSREKTHQTGFLYIYNPHCYLHQEGYVFTGICLLAGLCKNILMGFSQNPVEKWHMSHGRNN